MHNVTNDVCLLLRKTFTVVTNLSETWLGISPFRRINSLKLNHAFYYCTCLRVFCCSERLKIDANVTNFAGWLLLHLFYSSIWGWFVKSTEYNPIHSNQDY